MTAAIKERPILMAARLVRATLREVDPKTQTRRPIGVKEIEFRGGAVEDRNAPALWGFEDDNGETWALAPGCADRVIPCPFGAAGDHLWVRETFSLPFGSRPKDAPTKMLVYRASDPNFSVEKWWPSIHMPRWASRITLEVTAVRAEQLQAITEEDAKAEGVEPLTSTVRGYPSKHAALIELRGSYREAFARTWDEIYGEQPGRSWSANPWVWCISYKRVMP